MQVALISDIHGNLTALEAVLADIIRRNIPLSQPGRVGSPFNGIGGWKTAVSLPLYTHWRSIH